MNVDPNLARTALVHTGHPSKPVARRESGHEGDIRIRLGTYWRSTEVEGLYSESSGGFVTQIGFIAGIS
jgi:hypothetical protein